MTRDAIPPGFYPHSGPPVSTESVFCARASAEAIRAEHHRATGEWCSIPEALAAAFYVPDGTPVAMAAVNVGVTMDPIAAARFERERDGMRRVMRGWR
jgi:hypothetical protein